MHTGIMRTLLTISITLLMGFAFSTKAESDPISIAMPDTVLEAGVEIQLPVSVDEINADHEVVSGEFTLNYDTDLMTIDEVHSDGTVLDGTDMNYSVPTGRIAFASAEEVEGSGTLFYLNIRMNEDAEPGDATSLSMSAQFNEGEPEAEVTDGGISVPQLTISPSSVVIMEGETAQFEAEGDIFEPVNWWVSNEELAEIDDSGQLTALEEGTIRVFAEDDIGSRDSTEAFRINSEALAELEISTPDTTVRQTREFQWPIQVSDLDGLEVVSVQFDIGWSVSHLEFQGIELDETLLEDYGSGNVEYNYDDGEFSLAAAGDTALEGEGTLVYLNFRVTDDGSGNRSPDFSEVLFNDDLEPDLDIGTISIDAAPDIILSDELIHIVAGQSTTIEVDEGGTSPYTWHSDDEGIAEIDEETGEVTAIERGTTEIYAIDDEGFESRRAEIEVFDVGVATSDQTLELSSEELISVVTDDITDLGIFAFEAKILADSTLLNFKGIETDETLSEDMSISYNASGDTIRIAAAGDEELSGDGSLFHLEFAAGDSATSQKVANLDFREFSFNDPGLPDNPTGLPEGSQVEFYLDIPDPQLLEPEDGAEDVTLQPEFTWESDFGDNYEIQIASDEDFDDIVAEVVDLTETSYTPDEKLEEDTTYWWQIRAEENGHYSDWSDAFSFTTKVIEPEAPTLVSPDDEATEVEIPVKLEWNAVAEADSYRIQIATDEGFNDIKVDSGGITDAEISLNDLDHETEYFWQVQAVRVDTPGEWSEAWQFTTKPMEPEVVYLESPEDGAEDVSRQPELTWKTDFGNRYEIRIAGDEDFDNIIEDADELDDKSYTPEDELEENTTYWWKVRAEDNGDYTDWSDAFHFTTLMEEPEAPVLSLPENEADDIEMPVSLEWNAVAEADSYYVRIATDADFDELVIDSVGIEATDFEFEDANHETEYFWQVQAIRVDLPGEWSETWSFTTQAPSPDVVQLESPADESDDVNLPLNFEWEDAEHAESYRIQISEDQDFNELIADSSDISDTGIALSPQLESLETYYWRVQSKNDIGEADWSDIWSFQTSETVSAEELADLPEDVKLKQNYPNPFNPITTIRYAVPEETDVQLEVYNTLGEHVATLVSGRQSAGEYEVDFDGSDYSSGVFLYRLQSGDQVITRKMLLVK